MHYLYCNLRKCEHKHILYSISAETCCISYVIHNNQIFKSNRIEIEIKIKRKKNKARTQSITHCKYILLQFNINLLRKYAIAIICIYFT